MRELFFVEERVAGRCGPDSANWNLDEFRENNIAAILSVNDGEMVHVSRLNSLGITYRNIPLSNNAPVREGDSELCLAVLPQIAEFINDYKNRGIVVVHCKSGKDRTGLALAAYMMLTKNIEPEMAIEAIKAVRSIAFTAPGWEPFSLEVLTVLKDICQGTRM